MGGMSLLEELWLDGNRLQTVPTFIGNLINLRHLDLSVNQLTDLTDQIGCCTKLIDLTLSTNDLQVFFHDPLEKGVTFAPTRILVICQSSRMYVCLFR